MKSCLYKSNARIFRLAAGVIGVSVLVGCTVRDGRDERTFIKIGDAEVKAEVVRTSTAKQLGLSGRGRLAEGTGMLFVYDTPGLHGIWMKDMNFPLDILWIGAEDSSRGTLRVFDMEKNVLPETYPTVFTPSVPSTYVLEVNAGFAEGNGVEVGDTVTIDW